MADPITWYALGRTVVDTETILEAVDTKILTHNLDPSAHGQGDESLYNHRVLEILDHIDGAVRFEHLPLDHIFGFGNFESFDGWQQHGALTPGVFGAIIATDGDSPISTAYIWPTGAAGDDVPLDFTKNPAFQTTIQIGATTSQRIYVGAGDPSAIDAGYGFGFKILNNTLYAVWHDGSTEHTHEIVGIAGSGLHCFRVVFDSATPAIQFYHNGDLVYTATSNLPTGAVFMLFSFFVERTSGNPRSIYPIDWVFQMDR